MIGGRNGGAVSDLPMRRWSVKGTGTARAGERDPSAFLGRLRATLQPVLDRLDFKALARHNYAYWRVYATRPFYWLVEVEWPYYWRVFTWYQNNVAPGSRVLEIGTFVPVVPLLLSWEGYDVTTIERVDLYGEAFSPLVDVVSATGSRFIDGDVLTYDFGSGTFDAVNLLAVLEHLHGSPRELLTRIKHWLRPGGALVLVVPNQARLAKRLGLFLLGRSVHPPFCDYFNSAYPFSGHHREYTFAEVRYALENSGYQVQELSSVRYPPRGDALRASVEFVANLLPRTFHHAIFAIGRTPF